MSLNIEWRGEDALGFPRVSGDEPEDVRMGVLLGGFSPRERG